MADSLDQNAQQATTSPKKVWQKPEVYLLDAVNSYKNNPNAHENTMTGIHLTPGGAKYGYVHNGAYPVDSSVNYYALFHS